MKSKIIGLGLLLLIVFVIFSMQQSSAAVAKKSIFKKSAKTQVASSSDQILAYLKLRPFYSTSTKDKIIKNMNQKALEALNDKPLYTVIPRYNNKYEESNVSIPFSCLTEIEDNLAGTTTVKYYTDPKNRNIVSSFSLIGSPQVKVDLPIPLLHYTHFATTTSIADIQKFWMRNTYFYDDKDGYTWSIELAPIVYKQACADFLWERIKFQFESVPGYSYAIGQGLKVGQDVAVMRGQKLVKNNDVRFMYMYLPSGYRSNIPVFTVDPFEGSNGDSVDGGKFMLYAFKKQNIIYWFNVYTDRPDAHKFSDELLSNFFK